MRRMQRFCGLSAPANMTATNASATKRESFMRNPAKTRWLQASRFERRLAATPRKTIDERPLVATSKTQKDKVVWEAGGLRGFGLKFETKMGFKKLTCVWSHVTIVVTCHRQN